MPDPDNASTQPLPQMSGANGRPVPRVLIVGASARAAAFSAIRAGLQPVCADQFADVDLQNVAKVSAVEDYPQGLTKAVSRLPDGPVVYTGALENHPQILTEIAAQRAVLGNDAATATACRDPHRLYEVLSQSHVPCLGVRRSDDPPPPDGQWLLKPIHGAAGRGIVVWDEAASASPTLNEPHYFQQRGGEETISAVYLAAQDPLQVRYVGLTRQLVGRHELNAPPFSWCGSIGPLSLETRGEILARRVGTVLAHRFGLQGLFGCDFVLNADGEPLLTELNPRYTGSTEVLECLCGATLLADHVAATGGELPEDLQQSPVELPGNAVAGKAILYSDRDLLAPDTSNWEHTTPEKPLPGFADLPRAGSLVRRGGPFCSIFAAAGTFELCEAQLLQSAASVQSLLESCPSPATPVENPHSSP